MSPLLFLSVLLMLLGACSGRNEMPQGQLIAGNWGELRELDQLLPSRAYLIDLKENDHYKVCYQASLAARWPQFEAELETALAHWGRYIGASLIVETRDEVFPSLPKKNMSVNEALAFYQEKACPEADLIVAEFDLDGPLAQVMQSYSYIEVKGKKQIKKLTKGLLIQKESHDFNWVTFNEAMGPDAIDSIHDMLLSREHYYIRKEGRDHLLITTLIHEAGHIWGLCDQYELAGGQTNCHAHYSTKELIDDSIMAKEPLFIPIFLRNDDIEGIEHLANRRKKEWNSITVSEETPAPKYRVIVAEKNHSKLTLKAVVGKNQIIKGMIDLKIFDENGDHNSLSASVVTSKQDEEHFETIELDLDPRWQVTSATFTDSEGIEYPISLD